MASTCVKMFSASPDGGGFIVELNAKVVQEVEQQMAEIIVAVLMCVAEVRVVL